MDGETHRRLRLQLRHQHRQRVDCDAVAEAASPLPGVVVARSYKYMCSNPGQEMIAQDIQDERLERIVVAACSPRMHEPHVPACRRDGRRQPLSRADGQHPRAVQLGARRRRDGHREGHGPRARGRVPRRAARAAGAHFGRHVPQHARARRRHRGDVGGPRAGRRRQARVSGRADKGSRRQRGPRRPDGAVPRLGARHDDRSGDARHRSTPTWSVMVETELEKLEGFVGNFKATLVHHSSGEEPPHRGGRRRQRRSSVPATRSSTLRASPTSGTASCPT